MALRNRELHARNDDDWVEFIVIPLLVDLQLPRPVDGES